MNELNRNIIQSNEVNESTQQQQQQQHEITKNNNNNNSEYQDVETNKLKFVLKQLKKLIGVKDILNLRISLPSQVLDPIPNLEYFHWLDRPDYFANLSRGNTPLERMLDMLRYSFTRYIRYKENRIVKPYNSVLGEFFACKWETSLPDSQQNEKVTITMLNEQISHHPPVSAFWYECKETGVIAQGNDHLTAKFTGTTVKILPGELARGIYITLKKHDNEEYHLTHGSAYVHGFFSGSLGVGLADQVVISCPLTKLRAIYTFKPESLFGKNRYLIEGAIFRFQPTFEHSTTEPDLPTSNFQLKHIPKKDIIATLSGSWHEEIILQDFNSKEKQTLIDLRPLQPLPKLVKPLTQMDPKESRKVWHDVTCNILSKEYSKATAAKVAIEEKQREEAKLRGDVPYEPKFFYCKDGQTYKYYLKPNLDVSY